jgi:beta-phosphoglucomutase
MIMDTLKAIIFDMDGVIVDSEHIHARAEHLICQQYGIDAPLDQWDMFVGKTEHEMFTYLLEHFTDGTLSLQTLSQAKASILPHLLATELQLIPGVMPFLEWVKACRLKTALTTSSKQHTQQIIFRRYALDTYFDVVITGDAIHCSKPHPEPYLKTLAALNLDAGQCLVIEDSLYGIRAAKSAGCRVVGITTSFAEEKLREAGADVIISRFTELHERLAGDGQINKTPIETPLSDGSIASQ